MTALEVLVDGRAFLESPRWHEGALWVADMHGQEVLRVSPEGQVSVVFTHDGFVSALGFLPGGALLVSSIGDSVLLKVGPDGAAAEHADLSGLAPWGLNDMIVDEASGRAYVGTYGYDVHGGAPYGDSDLVRVDPDGRASVAASGLRFANGPALTGDGRTLIIAESVAQALTAFRVADDGSLHDRRPWAELDDKPDGICLDAAGAVWVAAYQSGHFVRVEEGGRVTHRIPAPDGRHAIAVALGGHTLYAITAFGHHPDETRTVRASRIEVATVDIPGCE